MTVEHLLDLLQNSFIARAVSKSDHLVGAALQIFHIIGFLLLLAALLLVVLRAFGSALVELPLARVRRDAGRLALAGFALTFTSGLLIFIATPRLYVHNWAFLLKMALLAAALLVQWTLVCRLLQREQTPRLLGRATLVLSLGLWFGVSIAGRMIGFI
jgi:hypothetical protein